MLRRALCIAGLLGSVTAGAYAEDVSIQGCNELLEGEVGVREAAGDVGDTLRVNVTVHAASAIDAFVLAVDVPPGLLTYVGTERGDLTASFQLFGGNWFPGLSQVRIVAGHTAPIPAGATGRLAVVVFEVSAPGQGAFGTSGLQDDLESHVSCEDVHGTSAVDRVAWGRAKGLYRSGARR
jgi:hypothetical protein